MTIFDDVAAKLTAMEAACILGSAIDCDPIYEADSKTAYSAQFADLWAKIQAYKAAATGEAQLRDIIMMDFMNEIISDIVYTPTIMKIEAPYPTGYTDYWDLWGVGGLLATILAYPSNYYYEGCILSPTGTTPNIQADIIAANGAVTTDSNDRDTLIAFLRTPPLYNALIFLTENFTISGSVKAKPTVGATIYTTKHAKEIIEAFEFDTYIPSYIS
jgi:hypothetical protein